MSTSPDEVVIVPIAEKHVDGFHECLVSLAEERRYLAYIEVPSRSSTLSFVLLNIVDGFPHGVALAGEKVVGWCDISPMEPKGFQHCGRLGMGVIKPFRRKGVGTKLIGWALDKARKIGLERLEVEVMEANKGAIGLYEKHGFKIEGKKVKARKLDGVYEDLVGMGFLFE